MAFEIVESLADAQMSAYVNQLNKIDIDIEDIIKWFLKAIYYRNLALKIICAICQGRVIVY